jgi:hypothetical protein
MRRHAHAIWRWLQTAIWSNRKHRRKNLVSWGSFFLMFMKRPRRGSIAARTKDHSQNVKVRTATLAQTLTLNRKNVQRPAHRNPGWASQFLLLERNVWTTPWLQATEVFEDYELYKPVKRCQ